MILAGVGKRYRGHGEVLAEVDLELRPGRPVAVLGANASGKSTLLRIAAGASAPSSGRVEGRPGRVGHLAAPSRTTSRMTARTWLRHQGRLHGTPAADPGPVLRALGCPDEALAQPLRSLSTGTLRKIGLAAALACAAPLVVLDEPWSGLDAPAATALTRVLAGITGSTALLVADHTAHLADLPSVHLLRLESGRLVPVTAPPTFDVVITVVPSDPQLEGRVLVAELPHLTGWEYRDGYLTVRTPVGTGDAVLAAVLEAGHSVFSVGREDRP